MADFAQKTTPLGALRGILGSYPYSVGLFRELLQNSDDAKASKQIFVLDRRTHSTASLYHSNLASTQGPAFLAYNDANFDAPDWEALQSTYESSKATDSSKIGKYGVGFRSVFHITDCPQIVSGKVFAMFDPLQAFTNSAGKKLDLGQTLANSPGQLTSFSSLLQSPSVHAGFDGTVIRCPLRRKASKISSKVVQPKDITHLIEEFIAEEIDISLLFLQHIQHIEIRCIDEQGTSTTLAQLSISRSSSSPCGGDNVKTYTATVSVTANGKERETTWRILHCRFQQEEVYQFLEKEDTAETLKKHKLLPDVGIAIPFSVASREYKSGRLFTFLPLPLPTNFPVHIHAPFGLTQSRQNLRNSRETGLVPGSDDHILIRWNELLFNRYIPQAWRQLLEILVDQHDLETIFNAWPPEQHPATSGESVYWESLPTHLLGFIMASQSPIWPVYQPNTSPSSPTVFQSLDTLIVADPGISSAVLCALTNVGLRFTCPPQYIVNLIKTANAHANASFAILSPEEAHKSLLKQLAELQKASRNDIDIILAYLLSTKNVLNVVGLPIIRLVNGELVGLSLLDPQKSTIVALLNSAEVHVFGICAENAIPLHLLPTNAAETIRLYGPKKLNVEALTVPRIVEYLTMYPTKLGFDLSLQVRTDPLALKWLSAFWIWQNTYAGKEELYPEIKHIFLLPSARGLCKADSPLFRARGAHPASVRHLSSMGIPFLDDKFSETAQAILMSYGLLKSITDIHAILDSLPSSLDPSLALPKEACAAILTHLSYTIPASCSANGPLKPEHIHRLKSLPIYPVVEFTLSSGIVAACKSLPDGSKIRAINSTPSFLPSIPGMIFVQFPSHPATSNILAYIDPTTPKSLSDIDLLKLTLENFLDQPDHVLAATLQHMDKNRRQIPPFILEVLQQTSFVAVQDGSRRKPKEVVDPHSSIASLYASSPERNACAAAPAEQIIVQSLHSLKLMEYTLTIDMVQDRIEKISSDPRASSSTKLSREMLSLITRTRLDYNRLSIFPQQQWLPTSHGLRGSAECRDMFQLSRHLFDEVLAILEPFELPTSLRKALQWDQPLSVQVLIQQLNRVLDREGNMFSVVFDIIKEIGKRTCSDVELQSLRSVTQNRKWVPTNDGRLSDSASAIFSQPTPDSGFVKIYHADERTLGLLRQMGCADKPQTIVIISRLHLLRQDAPSLNVVTSALGLLRSLGSDLTEEDRSQLLIPDNHDTLQPFSNTFFNDIGDQANLVPSDNHFISHPLLDESLARKLLLGRLGLKYVDLNIPGIEMGVKPVVTVRNTLRTQYTEKQFVTEFLANAADANATEFTLLVNGFAADTSAPLHALSPAMAKFCTGPSLVIHNNAKFSDEDFMGICRTSVGGKEGRRETIGQFGLGALTMFHFTELAIIISNEHVLFLNPSKGHLPISDSAALMMSLNHLKKYFASHLIPVDGLFGFSITSDEPYDGTIFLLPLRSVAHCDGPIEYISSNFWTASQVETNILAALQDSAAECLIFTKLHRITGTVRNGDQTQSWTFEAERVHIDTEVDTGFTISDMTVIDHTGSPSTWKVANTSVQNLTMEMPGDLAFFSNKYRLRVPVAGLAMLFDDSFQKGQIFNFFSTLPLGISNSLPVHVNASFILASDRRTIRLDDCPETRYNKWLLAEVIPPLYYFLLGRSLQLGSGTDNKWWWPQHRSNDDPCSRLIVDAFYQTSLRSCSRKLFRSLYSPSITLFAEEAILCGDESASIEAALSALQPYRIAKLSKGVYRLAIEDAGISKVTPAFLKEEIMQDSSSIASLSFKFLEDVISYLSPNELGEAPVNLVGLRILPLDDGSFVPFADRSDSAGWPYFVWTPKHRKQHNFPSRYFVDHRLKTSALLKMGINVAKLDTAAMTRFIEECLGGSSPFETLPPHISQWIEDFWESWDEYVLLGLQSGDISEFPLVPTINPCIFVSLDQCIDGSALIVGGSSDSAELLRACLCELGLTVVRLDQEPTPEALRTILRSDEYPKLSIVSVLSGLLSHDDITQKFENIELELQDAFSSWARRNIQTIPDHLIEISRQLPIWPSIKNGSLEKLRSASEIYMLPDGLPLRSTGRFMSKFVASYGQLKTLVNPLTLEEVGDELQLPAIMDAPEIQDYKEFLRAWVPSLPSSYTRPIPVPNSSRTVTLSSDLYERGSLFEAAFGRESNHFIAQELTELQYMLRKHQLRHEDQLDVPMFRICAQAISSRQDEDTANRAAVLFQAYCVSLPMHVNADDRYIWHELDELSFVPRNMDVERRLDGQEDTEIALEIPRNIITLPEVVPPLNLVRKEFEAVAWTQRALFHVQPHPRVLLAYPELGRPDVSDVILHLRALCAINHTVIQRRIVLHDLVETYTFLNNNISLASDEERSQLSAGQLFLNVNDPTNDEWHWDDCEHLVFETHDTEGSFRYVRDFLKPFSNLLRNIGVLEVHHPNYRSDHSSNSDVSKLEAIRKGFDNLREQNYLTDVVFLVENTDGSDADSNSSNDLVAHRAFLAVVSEHFSDSFCGGYTESRMASQQDPVKISVPDYTRECVQSVLDYVYTGIQSLENAPLDLLLQIMQLSGFWRVIDLFEDMQKEIVIRKLITPLTLDLIKDAAEVSHADNLIRTCTEYEERNAEFISKVRRSVTIADQGSD